MSYEPQTIRKTIEDIESGKLIIPSLQRNFVWPENKITDLFDSLVRGYPIGTFLFWGLDDNGFSAYTFNKVLRNYKESRDKRYRGEIADIHRTEYLAILDGQQRITSMYVGIMGKYTIHRTNCRWDLDTSYTDKYLCVDILHQPLDSDDKYAFKFQVEDDIGRIIELSEENEDGEIVTYHQYWIKICDVYRDDQIFKDDISLFMFLGTLETMDPTVFTMQKRGFIATLLTTLRNVLVRDEVISVYTTPNSIELDKVVDIFVRVNSGGQKLDDADLILSIASGESTEDSFYDKISLAIDDIRTATSTAKEFRCDKKFVITVALLMVGASSLSLKNTENYSRPMINKMIAEWETVIKKIKAALIFIEKIGFDVSKLASSFIIPIAYYFYVADKDERYFEQTSSQKDRVYIRQWLMRSILNEIFSEGTGRTLLRIRGLIDEAKKEENSKISCFPLAKIFDDKKSKSLLINKDKISEIVDWKWPDYRIMPLLMTLSPSIPSANYVMDHIWPKTYFENKGKLKNVTPNLSASEREEIKSLCHYLPNIELLTLNENSQKNDQLFDSWIDNMYSDTTQRLALFERNIIPVLENYNFESFKLFFDKRTELLKQRISGAFPDSMGAINRKYGIE